MACTLKMLRRPRTEHTGTNDGDVRRVSSWRHAKRPGERPAVIPPISERRVMCGEPLRSPPT
jgi:hypothetical protein